jgi:hypothetical protein
MDGIVIVFKQNDKKTTLVVRSKNGVVPTTRNYNIVPNISLDNTLEILGLERVPFSELIPSCRKIKECSDGSVNKEEGNVETHKETHEKDCYICYEAYKAGEYQRPLPCGHVFHKKCIDKWLKTTITCPLCRNDIFTPLE